ncbi:MAG TPA: hypothetical protein VM580_24070, partial [Labilithrix sp.]|nr:hypothetical protein [Labilithrix sp.]
MVHEHNFDCGTRSLAACSSESATSTASDGGTQTQSGDSGTTDGSVDAGAGGCTLDPETETFGLTDTTTLVSIVKEEPTSLPKNARANTGRFLVDSCGVRVLAEIDKKYSIHTAAPGQSFTATSTNTIDDIGSIGAFRKLGDDFAVVATTTGNKSYLYR